MYFHAWRLRKKNQDFRAQYPKVSLPEDDILYETFHGDYFKYYEDGKSVASWLLDTLGRYKSVSHLQVLDWGCGPARIVRHLPALMGPENAIFGSDLNPETIAWCKANIPKVHFTTNHLDPPLPFDAGQFDFLYAISILTHLSEQRHQDWLQEIHRVLAPDGIALITTQGEAYRAKLTLSERRKFDGGQLIVRGKVAEGSRTFSAFQPPTFMHQILAPFDVLEHQAGMLSNGSSEQDIWILRRTD